MSDTALIHQQHSWKAYDWRDGGWKYCTTVYTWTKDHALACKKAKIDTPMLRTARFKVEYGSAACVPDGMYLCKNKPKGNNSSYVEDIYGEFKRLVRENAAMRPRWSRSV